MNHVRTPLGLTALFLVGLGLLVSLGGRATLAQPKPVAPVGPVPPGGKETPAIARDGFEGLTFPDEGEARDARLRFEAVNDYLEDREAKSVPWERVCETAQQLLDAKSDYFYMPKEKKGDANHQRRYVSIKDQTNRKIGTFPKEGRQFYQVTYGPTADAKLKEAVESGYDKAKLGDISQRYFHTQAGGKATLLLANLNLDTGHYSEAAFTFDRLIERPDSDELLSPRTLIKAALAFKRAGDPTHAEAAAKAWAMLEKKFPRDGLAFGRRSYNLDELKQEFTRPIEALFGSLGDEFVAMRYGNAAHTGAGVGGTPFLDPAFTVPMVYHTDGEDAQGATWIKDKTELALRRLVSSKGQVAIPGFFAVTAPNVIIYRSYDRVYAVVTKDGFVSQGRTWKAGDLLWATMPTLGGAQRLVFGLGFGDTPAGQTIEKQWWPQWEARMPTLLFENAQVGSLSHDGKNVYFVDDLAVPPPPQMYNPNMGFQPGVQQAMRGLVGEYSQLTAVDINTGTLKWSLGCDKNMLSLDTSPNQTARSDALTESAIFLGPPLPVNGKLYFLFEKDQQLHLACVDPNKVSTTKPPVPPAPPPGQKESVDLKYKPMPYPELIWVQKLGAPNVRLAQDSLRRVHPAYLAYADGVIICPTNCGAVVAVDINARSLLWARGYATAKLPDGMGGRGRFGRGIAVPVDEMGRPIQQTLQTDRWRAAAPIIAGGKVIVAAHDSDQIQCLDLRTGDLAWADDRKQDDLYVAGAVGTKVLVVGKEFVRAYDLPGDGAGKPKVAWQNLKIATPAGHGVATRNGLYYLPMIGDPDRKDSKEPQIWAIDADRGMAKSKTAFRKIEPNLDPRLVLGNLTFHDGQLFSQTAASVTAFPLIELKKQEMDRLLAENPKDPRGLTNRGELLLDDGKIALAIADFKEAQKHSPTEDVLRKIRQKLYLAYTEMLRNDFNSGEGILNEYEALCEVPIDDDNVSEKKLLMDEQVRRKALFLSLVAKGREKQGRLTDAFKYYRAFAAVGDNAQLVSIYDEPNSMTRPDVWARGRIDAMIRNAKDPAIRKPLEDMVEKDWAEVRGANDLGRLREFVKVFGPYFQSGREAQLQLSEKLLLTNTPEDTRDAQILLMQLWGTAEDATTQARAVDALARVMTRRGMLEDAVGLYSILGSKYAETTVRDGKTGADIYGDLITDKRLLPYLEPVRSAAPGKYKVEQQSGPTNRPFQQQMFTVQPDGELLPFFRRYRLAMEMNVNGNGTWLLRVTDRITGEERCKFPDLAAIQTVNGFNQGPPTYRLAQASGHLVLMTIGQWAYCFDLAEKRKLWERNLFGNHPLPPNMAPQIEPDPNNKDELAVRYEDGWTLRLGRSAVLQPNYACMVTRDGLVAVDPITGTELWKRANVSTKSQVFGDARHLFLIETTSAGTRSRVIRAVDGSTVEGTKDFSDLFTGKGRLAVLGRNLLLSETPVGSPQVLRLYDPLTGEDVWKKEFSEKAVLLKTVDPETSGYLAPDGKFEVLATRTGKSLFKGDTVTRDSVGAAIDEANLKDTAGQFVVKDPLLLSDAERFYLFLNRPVDPARNQQIYGYSMIRSVPVNGAAYAFDRTTGKRLWSHGIFEAQSLFIERFDELPVLIAAAQVMDPATKGFVYKVSVLDKQLGRLKHNKGYPQNGFFVSMYADPKTKAIELWRYDLRLRIVPDDDTKTASAVGQ